MANIALGSSRIVGRQKGFYLAQELDPVLLAAEDIVGFGLLDIDDGNAPILVALIVGQPHPAAESMLGLEGTSSSFLSDQLRNDREKGMSL